MSYKNLFGVMQGRLLPKYLGRYQAHPLGYWQDEFPIAASLGLQAIEFILDYNDADRNPLMSQTGLQAIKSIIESSGVAVRSICADYFMEAPLHVADDVQAAQSMAVLDTLIVNAAKIGVRDIVIPCVDQSSLREVEDKQRLVERLSAAAPIVSKHGMNLALETDLAPGDFAALLERLPFSNVTVNYDTGNSASLGFDVKEEFAAYGARISDIHIKDRIRNGGSVLLGTGNTAFSAFLDVLERETYSGPIIMQAFRDDEGVGIFKQQLDWVKQGMGSRLPVELE